MTPSHLPSGWQEWTIGDIAKLVGGGLSSTELFADRADGEAFVNGAESMASPAY